MFKENVQQTLDNSNLKQKIASLYSYLNNHLGIKEVPKVILTKSKKNADKEELGFTGNYDSSTKTIKLFVTDRSNSDILRSFSHEMIHHWQNEHGTLTQPSGNTSDHYAQEDPSLRKREYEAFLYGSILFRDFQDLNRYGPSKVENPLPKIV